MQNRRPKSVEEDTVVSEDLDIDWDEVDEYNFELASELYRCIDDFIDKDGIYESYKLNNIIDNYCDDKTPINFNGVSEERLVEGDADYEEATKKITEFIEALYDLRKESIAKDGEYGLGNLVFKEMRNLGYINELRDMKRKLMDKELSLEHLNESAETHTYVYNGPALIQGRRGWFVHVKAEGGSRAEGIDKLLEKVRKMFPKANPAELDILRDSVYEEND